MQFEMGEGERKKREDHFHATETRPRLFCSPKTGWVFVQNRNDAIVQNKRLQS